MWVSFWVSLCVCPFLAGSVIESTMHITTTFSIVFFVITSAFRLPKLVLSTHCQLSRSRTYNQHWQASDGAELCREGSTAGIRGNRALTILSQFVRPETFKMKPNYHRSKYSSSFWVCGACLHILNSQCALLWLYVLFCFLLRFSQS